MFEPETPLAQNHPEFGLARDMAALSKFLLTMQTREAELIRRRMDQNRMLNFSFTFEEGGRKSSWELRTKTDVRWEVVGFRGKKFILCFYPHFHFLVKNHLIILFYLILYTTLKICL